MGLLGLESRVAIRWPTIQERDLASEARVRSDETSVVRIATGCGVGDRSRQRSQRQTATELQLGDVRGDGHARNHDVRGRDQLERRVARGRRREPELVLIVDTHPVVASGREPDERAHIVNEAVFAAGRSRDSRKGLVGRKIGRRATGVDPVDDAGNSEGVALCRAGNICDVWACQPRQHCFGKADARRQIHLHGRGVGHGQSVHLVHADVEPRFCGVLRSDWASQSRRDGKVISDLKGELIGLGCDGASVVTKNDFVRVRRQRGQKSCRELYGRIGAHFLNGRRDQDVIQE